MTLVTLTAEGNIEAVTGHFLAYLVNRHPVRRRAGLLGLARGGHLSWR